MVKATPRRFYPRERDNVPTVQKNVWAPGQVWTSGENLARTSIRSPDRPSRNIDWANPAHVILFNLLEICRCFGKDCCLSYLILSPTPKRMIIFVYTDLRASKLARPVIFMNKSISIIVYTAILYLCIHRPIKFPLNKPVISTLDISGLVYVATWLLVKMISAHQKGQSWVKLQRSWQPFCPHHHCQ